VLSLLIVGGTKEQRKNKALDIAKGLSSSFDTSIIDTQESAGIDTVRTLNQKLTHRPFESSHQSIILLEAQNLTIEAQNAFLKSLEETSPSAQIILTAATSESLLSTVASRCQKIELPTQGEETSPEDWRLFKNFLKSSLYDQYQGSDKLDLEGWLALWRKILLATIGLEKIPLFSKTSPDAVLRYIRLINKLRSLQKRRAAPRLLKTILILEAPKIMIRDGGLTKN